MVVVAMRKRDEPEIPGPAARSLELRFKTGAFLRSAAADQDEALAYRRQVAVHAAETDGQNLPHRFLAWPVVHFPVGSRALHLP